MKNRYRLFKRGSVFYAHDSETNKQESLKTKDKREAQRILILGRIRRALPRWKTSRRFLPKSTMGVALDYALSNWSLLEVYVHDGRIEIDNNSVENAICFSRLPAPSPCGQPAAGCLSPSGGFGCPTAIGKKNWLFIGSTQAGQRSAILFTLIESCRRRGITSTTSATSSPDCLP